MRKLIALATLSAVAGVGTVTGLAGTASADSATGIIKQYTMSYTSPSDTSYAVHKGLPQGQPVEALCARDGQVLDGNGTWFLIKKDGNLGYVHLDKISAPTDLPEC